ncbi:Quaternary ammonium compound-resistance protein SugE [Campylobacter lari]|uniref:Multidrug efflux system protein, EmrE family n=1 Tax=Campylobacter lari NCTC 11845 TaxID=1388749 RepID=A0A0A8HWS8_CAMLA|nr:multidrug efflux SMR transporter [Campylobacter lari]AJD02334.1 multidrug efflux system protein, EmrE family [Campylobacter lari NCTC 11845]EAK0848398.1 multidrug efflux SMR transporter [Campylobacter lari]EAK0979646.1 multidrug efflux SMR transporter [Campylobacter lari]EAK9954209.1 multidrug efflux SMR transporter [Campylobacter lari]MCR6543478.1 multidrug efflux SMR transporter [Campylobacter lari]
MHWLVLAISIVFEVIATSSMKYASISKNNLYLIVFAIFFSFSLAGLFYALKKIDLSIAYAIWAGCGITLISVVGFLIFKETITINKLIFIVLIVIGVVGLKLSA